MCVIGNDMWGMCYTDLRPTECYTCFMQAVSAWTDASPHMWHQHLSPVVPEASKRWGRTGGSGGGERDEGHGGAWLHNGRSKGGFCGARVLGTFISTFEVTFNFFQWFFLEGHGTVWLIFSCVLLVIVGLLLIVMAAFISRKRIASSRRNKSNDYSSEAILKLLGCSIDCLETIMKWHGWFFTHACETVLCNYYLFSSPLTNYFSVQVRHSFLATTLISFFYSISMPWLNLLILAYY